MAIIHIEEIFQILSERITETEDCIEIYFDDDNDFIEYADEEYANKVILIDSAYGEISIFFDGKGDSSSLKIAQQISPATNIQLLIEHGRTR